METNGIGFRMEGSESQTPKEDYPLEHYKDGWVLINSKGNGSFMGYLQDTDSLNARFLPYQKFSYKDNGMGNYYIERDGDPKCVDRIDIIGYRPGSEQESQNFCNAMNRKAKLDWLREKKETFELENQSKQIDEFKDNLENRIIQPFKKSTN